MDDAAMPDTALGNCAPHKGAAVLLGSACWQGSLPERNYRDAQACTAANRTQQGCTRMPH